MHYNVPYMQLHTVSKSVLEMCGGVVQKCPCVSVGSVRCAAVYRNVQCAVSKLFCGMVWRSV